jgi:hypothetical protein
LLKLIASVEALANAEARGQLDPDGQELLARLEGDLAAFPGRDLVAALRAWRHAGRPTRDPRPPRVEDLGDAAARRSTTRGAGL